MYSNQRQFTQVPIIGLTSQIWGVYYSIVLPHTTDLFRHLNTVPSIPLSPLW